MKEDRTGGGGGGFFGRGARSESLFDPLARRFHCSNQSQSSASPVGSWG